MCTYNNETSKDYKGGGRREGKEGRGGFLLLNLSLATAFQTDNAVEIVCTFSDLL